MLTLKKFPILAALVLSLIATAAPAQSSLTSNDLVDELKALETTPNIDVASLRQQAIARAKSNPSQSAVNRPPVAEQLLKLPQLTVEVQFDLDSATIRPASYPTLGRIADALYHPYLLGYRFLVVGHTDATGKREYNVTLSQKRADAIRDALVNVFRIPATRVQAVGLGEEQLQDAAHPTAAVNRRVQIVTIGMAR